ncbi:heterokaryon incompatibility protein-domain-containing protein, partial [Rhypophila decipiens]
MAFHCTHAETAKFVSHVMPPTAGQLWKEGLGPVEVAQRWLATCLSSHEHCRIERQPQQHERPSRLVAIDHDTGKVKLVSTASMDTLPPYASLSYRWGTADFTRLTAANYDAFHSSIPLDLLPQTFQDAIHITTKLNLGHIWIDALCIIQHEPDNTDWLREAGRMRSVYGSATINLAASWTRSVHGSLFSLESPLAQKKTMKPAAAVSQNRNSGGFCARVTRPHLASATCVQNFHSPAVYEDYVANTRLARRAWALQEKLLAPRTLHLGTGGGGREGLFWECRSSVGSDSLPDGFPGRLGPAYLVCGRGVGRGGWNWLHIVEKYTATRMTVPGDKLPALAGIARAQHVAATAAAKLGDNNRHDQYLAGMWRERFLLQLGWWVAQKRKRRRPRPREWRAPSWSWAAVDGPARFSPHWEEDELMGRAMKFLRVVDVWTTPAGPDPFGAVTRGELTFACEGMVRGWLVVEGHDDGDGAVVLGEADWTETRQPVRVDRLSGRREYFGVLLDCSGEDVRPDEALYLVPIVYGETGARVGNGHETADTRKEEKEKNHEIKEPEEWNVGMEVVGMVLQCCGGVGARGRFRRVGAFRMSHMSYPNKDFEREHDSEKCLVFLEVLREVGASTAEAECARVDVPESGNSDLRYVITI